jgi:hypothetical protein
MLLMEVHDGLFAEPFRVAAPAGHPGWWLLTPCDAEPAEPVSLDSVVTVCPLLREAGELDGGRAFEDFDSLLREILKRGAPGRQWDQVFDDKHLHEIGDVTLKRASGKVESWKILQFQKKQTLIRIAWSYAELRRTVLLTHMFVKPGGKRPTPPSEVTRAKDVLQSYLQALDTRSVKLIEPQGGIDGFQRLVR